MSRFLSERYRNLIPYTPGEQPRNMSFIKLNTNESPFPPSDKAIGAAARAAKELNLYPDPECRELSGKIAETLGVKPSEVLVTNGSDEILNFAFAAFCDKTCGACFPDITYGFYKVFAELYGLEYKEIPLKEDFSIDVSDYFGAGATVFIANPNAPTGIALDREQVEKILINNPNNVVVIDEAYVDFGAKSCVSLINKYPNLLVTQTFSKSRSMAGGRLGFGIACEELIRDLNTIKYSTNPYNINKMTAAAGLGTLEDAEYTEKNCRAITKVREYTEAALGEMGFECTKSAANFVFAKHPTISGECIYSRLRDAGILVRHFGAERIKDYNRITVGTEEQMKILIEKLKEITEA